MTIMKKIKPLAILTYRSALVIYWFLFISISLLIGLAYFDILTADNLNITGPLFSAMYLKLKCSVWLLFFVGILFLMLTSKDKHVHTGSLDSSDSFVFFAILSIFFLSAIIFQPFVA